MKSVVLEIKGKFAAVLSDDGSIKKVKNRNYAVGQEIWSIQKEEDLKMKNLPITKKMALCASCAAIMLFGTGAGVWVYAAPYSYVSLDVNPSIEYTLNRLDRVIKVKAVNDDGQAILDELNMTDLKNKTIEDAILATVQQISNEGYFEESNTEPVTATASEAVEGSNETAEPVTATASEAAKEGNETAEPATATASQAMENSGTDTQWGKAIDGGIVITVSGGNRKISDKFVLEIREAVEKLVDETVEVEVSSVGLERVREARTLGVTPGKLNLVEKLKSSAGDPDSIVIEEWLNRPVKDIMKEIKKNRKTAVAEQPETTSEAASPSDAVSNTMSQETSGAGNPSAEESKAADVTRKEKPSQSMKPDKTEKTAQEKETKSQLKEDIKVNQEGDKQEKAEVKEQSKEVKESEKTQSKDEKQESKADSDKSSDEVKEKQETPVKKSNPGNSKKGS
ncbi:anti-sigma-I factor RsgI family protein [Lacrimispora sp. 38-1]|uniref:anti-sigma factor domain-containing protein n=1 Tax=Lacrimispora sp. 38-1 TaxID=3125778 RepID=UPI003CF8E3BE